MSAVKQFFCAMVCLIVALLPGALPANAQNRFAFVVGNDAYDNIDPLKKAVNDSRAIAAKLQSLGYRVTHGENFKRRQFNTAFSTFEGQVQPGDITFVFYSGHGVELDGANYLVPVDIPKEAAQQQSLLKDEAISTDNIIQRLKARGARAQIIVLDACRENPFRDRNGRSLGAARGLGPTQAPGGVFIMYSAGVGEVALDRLSDSDADPNSIFTRALLPLMSDGSRNMVAIAKETRARVKALAGTIGATQSPAYYDEIDGDLFLGKGAAGSTGPQVAAAPIAPAGPVAPQAQPQTQPQSAAPRQAAIPPPPSPAARGENVGGDRGLMFPDSDRRRLNPNELRGLSQNELRIARNEIYARRGRFFRDAALDAHFRRFAWYRPHSWDVPLNAVEQANVKLIQSWER